MPNVSKVVPDVRTGCLLFRGGVDKLILQRDSIGTTSTQALSICGVGDIELQVPLAVDIGVTGKSRMLADDPTGELGALYETVGRLLANDKQLTADSRLVVLPIE